MRSFSLKLVVCLLPLADPATLRSQTWVERSPMPTARASVGSALIDGLIFVVGGLDRFPTGSTVLEAYDPSSDQWSRLADLPLPKHHVPAVALHGRLWVAGGYMRNTSSPSDELFVYDPAADKWEQRTSLTEPRGGHAMAAIDGRLFLFGGTRNGVTLGSVAVYDPPTENWSVGTPMRAPRDNLVAVGADTLIYLIGGRRSVFGSREPVATVDIYSPATDTWREGPPMLTARSDLSAVATDGSIYAIGGQTTNGVTAVVERLDPAGGRWTQAGPMTTARHGAAAAVVDEVLYVIGGSPNPGPGVTPLNLSLDLTGRPTAVDVEEVPGTGVGANRGLIVFPNPGKMIVTVDIPPGLGSDPQIAVFDVLGRRRGVAVDIRNRLIPTIDVSGLESGLYVVTVETAGGRLSHPFLKTG